MTQITLHTKERDYTFDVEEMSALDHMHAKRYRDGLIANPNPDEDAQILLLFFYSNMANASRGEFPSAEVFLTLSPKESDKWYITVNECNPGVLPQPHDPSSEEAVLEKKD